MAWIESQEYESPRKRLERQTRETLSLLSSNVRLNNDPWIIRLPRLIDWAAVFNYKYMWWKWEIVTRKDRNGRYSVRVKKWERLPNWWEWWRTKKNGNDETFTFSANDRIVFNRQLWTVLDKTIWINRDRLPDTWRRVYELLNKEERANNQERNPNAAPEWLRLENWVYVYRVQRWDTRSGLISKLSKYPPLAYLKDWYWWRSTSAKSFNVGEYLPDSKFHEWVDLIVPNEKFTKTVSEFRNTQLTAIEKMKRNTTYWEKIRKLFKPTRQWWYGLTERQVANTMTAFARSESSYKARNNYVWECALFRYEPSQVFSYGYHHILKAWAWDNAFKWLGFSVWDACDPMKSGMLFLAYCIEKRSRDYQKFFDIDNNLIWCCENYNWANRRQTNPDYDKKLKDNYTHIKSIR